MMKVMFGEIRPSRVILSVGLVSLSAAKEDVAVGLARRGDAVTQW